MESLREVTDIELDEVNGGAAAAAATTGGNVAFALSSESIQVTVVPGLVQTASIGPFGLAFAF